MSSAPRLKIYRNRKMIAMHHVNKTTFCKLVNRLIFFIVLAGGMTAISSQASDESFVDLDSKMLVLENGLEVLLIPNSTSRLVTAISVIKAGSAYENPRVSGASHFLEHMLFNGTNRRTQKEIYAVEDFYGGFNNAFTRKTHAAFMITMPANNAEFAFDLQSDMLFNSRLPNQNFEKERGIILEELAKDQVSDTYQMEKVFAKDMYPESAYGLPVVGTSESIKTMKLSELRAYYKKYYVPENICLVVLGGFDESKIEQQLSDTYGKARSGDSWLELPAPPEAITDDRTFHHKFDMSQSTIRLIWNAPSPLDPSFLASSVAVDLIFSGASSPLSRKLEERFPGKILGCGGYLETGYQFGRLVLDVKIAAGLPINDVIDSIEAAILQIQSPSDEQIAGWKTASYADEIFSRQRSYMYAPLSSEKVANGGVRRLESYLERVHDLSSAEVAAAAKQLARGNRWILIAETTAEPASGGPGGMVSGGQAGAMPGGMPPGMPKTMPSGMGSGMPKTMPSGMASDKPSGMPAGMPKGMLPAKQSDSTAKEPPSDDRMAMEQDDNPAANAIENAPYTIDRYATPNGINLLSISAPSDGSLSIYLLIEGRNYLEPEGKEGITELLHRLLTTGTKRFDEAELEGKLAAIGGQMQCSDRGFIPFDDYYTQRDFSFIRFQALDQFADEAFDLLTHIINDPLFDPMAVEREKNRMIARLDREARSKSEDAYRELRSLLFPEGHPESRSSYGRSQSIAGITRDDLVAYHKRLFDSRRIWVGVVSGLSLEDQRDKIENLLPSSGPDSKKERLGFTEDRFALWKNRSRQGELVSDHLTAALKKIGQPDADDSGLVTLRLDTQKEGRGQVVEMILLPQSIRASDEATWSAMTVAGKILSSRLAFELREEKALAYGIGASVRKMGDRIIYTASAGTRAQNLAEMADGFSRIRQDSDKDLNKREVLEVANNQYGRSLRRQETRLNQAMFSVWAAREGQEASSWWSEGERLQQLSPEVVSDALKQLATAKPAVVIIAE